MKLLKMDYLLKVVSISSIHSAANSIEPQCPGQKPYLTADEEALVIATAEIKGSHSQPVQHKRLAAQLNSILENMPNNPRTAIVGGAKMKSQLAYARNKPGMMEGQTMTSRLTGETRVSSLRNSQAKQSNP
jgi:hypothetical protein